MRFVKLLFVAWVAWCLADQQWPSAETLGGAFAIAFVTWLIIHKYPADDFRLLSKPSAAMIVVAGLAGWGARYDELNLSGLNPNQKVVAASLTIAGLLVLIGAIGIFILPSGGGRGATQKEPRRS